MPKGRQKKTHKGGHRHFTNEDQLAAEREREARQKEWRRQKGLPSESEESEEEEAAAPAARGAPGELPPSESSSEEESDEEAKSKGVSHLIDIENPNRVRRTTKKVTELGDAKTQLSRREREELEKQQAKANYQKMHLAGKTEEARADLARLALIRKQREEAAKKKEEEAKAREAQKEAAEKKLLEKKKAAKQ